MTDRATATAHGVGLAEDVRLVSVLLRKRGNAEQRRWFAEWCRAFVIAASVRDDERSADLHDELLVFSRRELQRPERDRDLDELLRDLGLRPKPPTEA
jgi:hypothetical protein